MTRDVVMDYRPVRLETERNPPGKGCRKARREEGCLLWLVLGVLCPPLAPPSRHAYVLRIHTLTCHRVKTELIEVNLSRSTSSPLSCPSYSFKTRKSMPSSLDAGRRDAPCDDFASRKSSLVANSAWPSLPRGRFVCSRWISRAIRHGNSCRAVL